MVLRDFASRSCEWLDSDTSSPFISTRIRFARNMDGFFFPNRAGHSQQAEIRKLAFEKIGRQEKWKNCKKIALEDIDITDRRLLLERHLASYDLVFTDRVAGLVVNEKESMSIMVNEEDHLRLQIFGLGFNLNDTFNLASCVSKEISENFDFAKHPEFGFLTACPTNVGTGLRISFLAHLPALVRTNHMGEVIDSLSRLGIVVRGFYGEATNPVGDFFQISNQITLGVSENDIIEKLTAITSELEDASQKAENELLKKNRIEIEDAIYRSYGIIQYAKKISYEELMSCVSDIRFGLKTGMPLPIGGDRLNDLLFLSQPAHIEERAGRNLPPPERDEARSEFIKETLG
ncbi:MAG: ATP--guanido phosphotransferase [bacterium]